jgi:hypothetical protein
MSKVYDVRVQYKHGDAEGSVIVTASDGYNLFALMYKGADKITSLRIPHSDGILFLSIRENVPLVINITSAIHGEITDEFMKRLDAAA